MIYDAQTLKARIEAGRTIGAPTSTALSVTGEPYVIIGCQLGSKSAEPGTVDEGCAAQWSFDAANAYFSALACFEAYASEKRGALYWRQPPVLEMAGRHYRFCMRCLISDRPKIPSIKAA